MKHPQDKAQRLYINDQKKRKKANRGSKEDVHDGSLDSLRSDDEAERDN